MVSVVPSLIEIFHVLAVAFHHTMTQYQVAVEGVPKLFATTSFCTPPLNTDALKRGVASSV